VRTHENIHKENDNRMAEYTITYRFGRTETEKDGSVLTETINAESREDAQRHVRENLYKPLFIVMLSSTVDAVVRTDAITYVGIHPRHVDSEKQFDESLVNGSLAV
jgi:hypothetical protein